MSSWKSFPKMNAAWKRWKTWPEIYKDKLKDPRKAAMSYARISEIYPDYKEAPDRLLEAGELTEKKLKDYAGAVAYYQMVIDKYNSHKKAKDALKKLRKAQEKLPPPAPAEGGE